MDMWDWRPHDGTLLSPGSLVLVDPARRQVEARAGTMNLKRPIYFVDFSRLPLRMCVQEPKTLILQPYSLSPCAPKIFSYRRKRSGGAGDRRRYEIGWL